LSAARTAAVCAGALAALLVACAPPRAPQPAAALTGTISYRERIALPETARVEIQILDVTDEDADPTLITEKLLDHPGQVPIAFSIGYDPHSIQASHTYALRVRIHVGDDLWFASPFDLRVLTAGNPTRVAAVLDRISAGGPLAKGAGRVEDADPPGIDPRVRALRDEARAIDARLDRFDMREITEGPTQLRLWEDDDQPVKLEVADSGPITRPSSYYFRDGTLFWMRGPSGGYAFEGQQLVLRTDARLTPVADPGSGAGVLNELAARLALFGL
jgi:putative lipoprotein